MKKSLMERTSLGKCARDIRLPPLGERYAYGAIYGFAMRYTPSACEGGEYYIAKAVRLYIAFERSENISHRALARGISP